mmetsp:Transcript_69138/g.184288  ORF Transcript_69138/g.184288 Transcript_69138/m.184288 type:complete len:225 (-) Transcript_69138:719-1393(-)
MICSMMYLFMSASVISPSLCSFSLDSTLSVRARWRSTFASSVATSSSSSFLRSSRQSASTSRTSSSSGAFDKSIPWLSRCSFSTATFLARRVPRMRLITSRIPGSVTSSFCCTAKAASRKVDTFASSTSTWACSAAISSVCRAITWSRSEAFGLSSRSNCICWRISFCCAASRASAWSAPPVLVVFLVLRRVFTRFAGASSGSLLPIRASFAAFSFSASPLSTK